MILRKGPGAGSRRRPPQRKGLGGLDKTGESRPVWLEGRQEGGLESKRSPVHMRPRGSRGGFGLCGAKHRGGGGWGDVYFYLHEETLAACGIC